MTKAESRTESLVSTLAAIFTLTFLLTSLVGVWAAYNRDVAWRHFGMIAAGLVLAIGTTWAGRRGGERVLGAIGLGCAVLAAAIGVYFMLTYDWTANRSVKFPALQQAGLWIQTHRPAMQASEDINPNVPGGGLALTLPLGVGGVAWAWTRRHWRGVVVGALALLLALIALTLTASRGAWLGFGAGMLTAGYLEWRTNSARWPLFRRLGDVLLVAVLLVVLAGFGTALAWPGMDRWLGTVTVPIGATAMARARLWRDALALVGDYPFTGSGLGSTIMVYSSYVLLVHVGFIDSHVHNLFLQIAVEQGLPGLAAFLGLLGVVIWRLVGLYRRGEPGGTLRLASTAALVALLVQGIGEAGNYTSRMVLIGFLPFGFALGLAPPREIRDQESAPLAFVHRDRWTSVIWRLAVILALAGLLLPDVQAAFQANLGAVAQTRAELSVYRWPEWPIQDAVRRSPDVNLAPAIAHYQAALVLAPANAAANRRLGQIELSLGQYQAARRHLEAAYAAAPGQRAVRQLLGESYAVEGEIERAAALWRTVDVSQGQLELRQWWYNHVGEPQRADWVAEAAACSTAE